MKRIFTIATALIMTASVWAQAPDKMSYQAVVRDASDALVATQAVGMQISILQTTATGTAVYVETHAPTTNINGLVSIEIGTGTTTDNFATIDWSAGPYFIKTETDPTGGTTYTITGTSQLMSVPYALHANTADSIVGGVSITETDPVFGASIANGITALDTANWNNHIIDTDTQLDETAVDAFVANNGYLAAEVDGSVTNEIQDLQLSGNNLTITNNGTATTIDLSPYLDNTDTQLDETAVDAFVANNGYLTTEVDGSVTNELQTISRTGLTVTLINGGAYQDSINTYTAGTGVDITNNVISTTGSATHAIGDSYGGGIVFYIWDGGAHGLISSTVDQGQMQWYNGVQRLTGTTGDGLGAGAMNTTLIVAQQTIDAPTGNYAAKACADYSVTVGGITYGDWYLPSGYELDLLYQNKASVGTFQNYWYWSSTEQTPANNGGFYAFRSGFGGLGWNSSRKDYQFWVRAIRAF